MPWIMDHSVFEQDLQTCWKDLLPDADTPKDNLRSLMSMPGRYPDAKYIPLHLRQIHKHDRMYDFMQGRSEETLVSTTFRDLIEAWDPGHSFYIPVVLHPQDGPAIENQFFWHKFKDFIQDALVVEESDVGPVSVKGRLRFYSTPHTPKLTWKAEKIAARHVWAAEYLARRFCVSDAFMDEVEARGGALYRKIACAVQRLK